LGLNSGTQRKYADEPGDHELLRAVIWEEDFVLMFEIKINVYYYYYRKMINKLQI
jgi:hypothetical protein